MEQAPRSSNSPEGLRRQLGLGSAAAAVAGEAIAVGIFLTPAGMAKALGSPFWLLAAWLFMGAITISGLCVLASCRRDFPRRVGFTCICVKPTVSGLRFSTAG